MSSSTTTAIPENSAWINAISTGITYSAFLSCFLCYLHCWYFLLRRYTFGNITKGRIISKRMQRHESKDQNGNVTVTYSYFVTYSYTDNRTDECTQQLVYKYCELFSNEYIPNVIQNMLLEYLGTPFTIYYGPHQIEQEIAKSWYLKWDTNDTILDVRYDRKFSKNANIVIEESKCWLSFKYGVSALIIFPLFGYSCYGLYVILETLIEYEFQMASLFGCIVLLSTVCTTCYCKKKKSCCFSEKSSKLKQTVNLKCERNLNS